MPLLSHMEKETSSYLCDYLRQSIRFNSTLEGFIISVSEMEKIVMIPSILMDIDTLGTHHTQEMVDLASDVSDMILTNEIGNFDLYQLFFALRSLRDDLEPNSENKSLIAMCDEKKQNLKFIPSILIIEHLNYQRHQWNLSLTSSSSTSSFCSYFSSNSTRVLSRTEDLDEKFEDTQHMMNQFGSNTIDLKLWLERLIRAANYIKLRYQIEIGCTD